MQILKSIFNDCKLNVQRYDQVHGGDINHAYCLFTSSGKFFLKVNDAATYPLMFEKEAKGLKLLQKNCELAIPKVIKVGEHEGQQYLLMEWFDKGSLQKNIWENFGAGLATLHKHTQKYFGLEEDNYIGSLQQSNTQHDSWSSFYSECRILPLVRELFNAGDYSAKDVDAASSFCNSIQDIFPIESPSLLHGDLWAGNYLITSSGKAAIFDPAVYFGHREMDIGMTKLFGGFDVRFYQSYNEVFPLENNWQKRIQFTQLYPLLVHAVLFGGHYISSTKKIFDAFK